MMEPLRLALHRERRSLAKRVEEHRNLIQRKRCLTVRVPTARVCVFQEFVAFFKSSLRRKVCWADRMEFINGWYLLLILSDFLTITGSFIKIGIESKVSGPVLAYPCCCVLLCPAGALLFICLSLSLSLSVYRSIWI